jgi:hypothetical protein
LPPFDCAFGDEAGETGFRSQRGSSIHFVVALVLVNEPKPLRDFMEQMRHQFRLPKTTELKFNRTSNTNRRAFFASLPSHGFVVRALAVDKRTLPAAFKKMDKQRFYTFFVSDLLRRIPADELDQANIVLDEFGNPKTTILGLKRALRHGQHCVSFRQIIAHRSRSEPLLQLADMVAGAILRFVSREEDTFYAHIAARTHLWHYDPEENPPS